MNERKFKPYTVYKPSGMVWIGEVPEGWKVRKLKWVTNIKNSNVDKKTFTEEKRIYLCNYIDVYKKETINSSIEFMEATATNDEIKKFIIKKDDVIITKDSEEWSDIAVPAYVEENFDDVICGYHLALLRPKKTLLDGCFLFRLLQSKPINTQFMLSANGITRFGLSFNSISGALIILPPLPEQQAISDFLDRETARINATIEKQNRLIELLKEKRSALISHTVTKGLDPNVKMKPSGVEWIGEITEQWEVLQTKRLFKILNGSTPSSGIDYYWDGDIVWLTPDDLGKNEKMYIYDSLRKITKKGYESCGTTLCPPGSIIISTRAPIGHLGVIQVSACANQGCRSLVPLKAIESRYYFYYYFSIKQSLESFGNGSTYLELSRSKLGYIYTILPPLPEQQTISDFLDLETAKIDNLIDKIEKQIVLLDEYKQSLITAAVTGKIDVRESVHAANS